MRTWKRPQWVADQEATAMGAGFARIKNYAGAGNGSPWLRFKWGKTFGMDDEQRSLMFRLKDEKTGQEYVLDKEEMQYWMRWV